MNLPLRISAWKFSIQLLLALGAVKLNSSSSFVEQTFGSVVESGTYLKLNKWMHITR